MPLPKLAGRYIATATSWKVGEYKDSPIFEAVFRLLQYMDPQSGWTPAHGDMEISKRFFLKKNDGSWSQHAIESIMNSLGWDGKSLKGLAEGQWGSVEVQLTIDYETNDNDGKEYIGVRFMNHRDYEGKKLASEPAIVQSLDAKYGNDLRAMTKTVKPTTRPTAPAPAATKPTDPKTSAWSEFIQKTVGMSKDERAAEWHVTVKGYSGKEAKLLTNPEWEHVANSISEHGMWVPPAAPEDPSTEPVPAMADEDIPF